MLADIADISGPRSVRETLGALLIASEQGRIERKAVIQALNVSGLENVSIELRMPPEVMLVSSSIEASRAAEKPKGVDNADEARLLSMIKSLSTWDGEVEAEIAGSLPEGRLIAPASIVPGTSAVTLRFRDNEGRERTIGVRLTWYQKVLVAAQPLAKDQPLQDSDFFVRSQRILQPDVYASELSQVVGRSLRKNLKQGQLVPLNLLSSVPAVKVGKAVRIVARGRGVSVSAQGVLMTSGAVGDEVKVRRLDNKAVLTAVVRDENTVEVRIP